jgi:hypothetical protein
MTLRIIVVLACATPVWALSANSRFTTGSDGWTVEGPGMLEWLPTGGNSGGCLRITRAAPGEVYLVAPPEYLGDWRGNWPRLVFSYRPAAPAGRDVLIEVSGPGGQFTHQTGSYMNPAFTLWNSVSVQVRAAGAAVLSDVTRVRIRLGTDPASPVGEVIRIDDIAFRSCSANCDGSTVQPVLTANDLICAFNAWVANDPIGDLDGLAGIYGPSEFTAFLTAFYNGCSSR